MKMNGIKLYRGPGRIRGLEKTQYITLFRKVKRGEVTWAELERRGLALPARRKSKFSEFVDKILGKDAAKTAATGRQ